MSRTFWNVVQECPIEIPLLQRDYAQGRLGPQAQQVRLNFVADCHAALCTDEAPRLDLGLVYGAIRCEYGGPERRILLDGQQRVTTLYLLHWYLGRRGAAHGSMSPILAGFSYETRITTREFCAALASEPMTITPVRPLSRQIEDASWFFRVWKQDASIAGMLVMLDAIHDVFGPEQDPAAFWRRLTRATNPPIVFRFLDLPGFELTDELYIKMNARGRPLSEFEKFKAWLESTAANFALNAPSAVGEMPRAWQEELDKEWTDFFWKLAGRNTTATDAMFLRCFHSIALNHAVVNVANLPRAGSADAPAQKSAELINQLIEDVIKDDFLSTKTLRHLYTEAALREIFPVMRRLALDAPRRTNEEKLFRFICESHQRNYRERATFHAWCRALGGAAEPDHPAAVKRLVHVVWYLLSNASVERSEEYARVLRSLDAIGREASADVDRYFAENEPSLVGFDGEHVREAIRKAKIIRRHPPGSELAQKWQAAFEDADNHPYFNGRINMLLELSDADAATPECLASFTRYAAIAKRIFDEKSGLVERSDFLFQRALLATDDDLIQIGRSWNLGRDRYYLRTYLFREPKHIARLRQVLSQLEPGREEAGLQAIIARAEVDDWRRLFIDCPAAIGACGQGNTRWENTRWTDVNDWEDGRYIRLLWGENVRGDIRELRSYCFYHRQLESKAADFAPLAPHYQAYNKGSQELPYAFLKADGARYRIEMRYLPWEPENSAYEIRVRSTNGAPLPASVSDAPDPDCVRSGVLPGGTGKSWFYPRENEAATGLWRLARLAAAADFADA